MKQEFITRAGKERLTILFAGWGMDPAPFEAYASEGSDLMICYDYGDMSFDASVLDGYRSAHIAGWSMGVWAADMTSSEIRLPAKYTAINGTPWPLDEKRGIPPAIFYGTLEALSDTSIGKFRRRMCGDADTLRRFTKTLPKRSIESLRAELSAIADAAAGYSPAVGLWNEAYVGNRDLIFPAANQKEAWRQIGCTVKTVDAAHYSEKIFEEVLL